MFWQTTFRTAGKRAVAFVAHDYALGNAGKQKSRQSDGSFVDERGKGE
jgi:hypothetical protein